MRERRSLRKRSKRSDDHLSLCVHSRDCSVSVKERVVITKGHGHNNIFTVPFTAQYVSAVSRHAIFR